ncbi:MULTISPECIES: GNAT family N-acetyltransferase [Streptosporangium]|uniref:Acetyltransferase n=1 Tax=Streptosporangium brasiliense TaxID=47480 RepID=A0ABT9RDB4_9ACTN|nr:GNAT family N-acetyltransferase [Streptosporangium brasiliense]MDP9867249.1 putative acetyltransferase [Streptosporangium brasiliense]
MELRDLTVDDLDAVLDNRKRAFGPVPEGQQELWRKLAVPALEEGRYLGVVDGARLVATSRTNDFTQWWHGRPISMGGVASVTVAPEDRGRGVGRTLMQATVDRCAALGHPVSALYPATTHIYRSLGWEHAGAMHVATLPAEALRTIRSTEQVKIRRMGPGDAPEVVALLGRVHAATRASGPLSRGESAWRVLLENKDDFLYLADDGFVTYHWDGGDIRVSALVAGSEATARALWSLVGTSASVAKSVRAAVAPDDPVFWLIGDRPEDHVALTRWMFRVVDLVAAVAGRGFPAGVTLDAAVQVDDPQRPGNSGPWQLSVSGGSGTAEPAATLPGFTPTFTAAGFSALYAGIPTATLRRSGILTGPADSDDALDAAFHAKPYMLDHF